MLVCGPSYHSLILHTSGIASGEDDRPWLAGASEATLDALTRGGCEAAEGVGLMPSGEPPQCAKRVSDEAVCFWLAK